MSRFAVVHEDPNYDEPEDILEWLNIEIDGGVMKGQEITVWSAGVGVGKTQLDAIVVKEPQSEEEIPYYGA